MIERGREKIQRVSKKKEEVRQGQRETERVSKAERQYTKRE